MKKKVSFILENLHTSTFDEKFFVVCRVLQELSNIELWREKYLAVSRSFDFLLTR
jgi:hypothetical protein